MRTVIGLFGDAREAKATIDDLQRLGARDFSVISSDGRSYGPLTTFIDQGSVSSNPDGIIRQLTQMGLSPNEAQRYVEGLRSGYTLEAATIDDDKADEALAIMKQHAVGLGGRQKMDGATGSNVGMNTGEAILPVVAEELRIGKREVEAGGVRVTSNVQEIPVEEQVQLREERVDVERRPVDRPLGEGDQAFRDQTFEVTAKSEEAVVQKQARVVEEVVVRKDQNVRTETIRDTVRRQDVNVEQLSAQYGKHFQSTYGTDGTQMFEDYAPAYEYGRKIRSDKAYANRKWDDIEPTARADWEKKSPGTWERFKGAVRHAWEDVKH